MTVSTPVATSRECDRQLGRRAKDGETNPDANSFPTVNNLFRFATSCVCALPMSASITSRQNAFRFAPFTEVDRRLISPSHDVTLMQILHGKGSTYFVEILTALRTPLSPAPACKVLYV